MTASALAGSWCSSLESTQKSNRRVKRFFDELSRDDSLSDPKRWFKVIFFYKAVDTALMHLQMRFNGQSLVTNLFNFLYPKSLTKYELSELVIAAKAVIAAYPDDFTENLETELTSFANEFKKEIEDKTSVLEIVSLMLESRVSSFFPEAYKLLVLFVTIPVTVARAERSFSKLKLIKTYLRSKISPERLANLAVLSIENAEAKSIDKAKLIQRFANVNARRHQRIGL